MGRLRRNSEQRSKLPICNFQENRCSLISFLVTRYQRQNQVLWVTNGKLPQKAHQKALERGASYCSQLLLSASTSDTSKVINWSQKYCLAEVYNANCHSLLYGLTLDVKAVLVTFTLTGACSSLKLLLRVWEWAQCHPTDGHKCRHVENLACTDLIPDFSSKQENWGEFLRSLRTKTTSTLNIPKYLPAQL